MCVYATGDGRRGVCGDVVDDAVRRPHLCQTYLRAVVHKPHTVASAQRSRTEATSATAREKNVRTLAH